MPSFYLIGKLGDNPRGKRLVGSLSAVATAGPPEGCGMCIGSGQDYQTRRPEEQRQWLTWASQPGCVLLMVPPFQTGVKSDPNSWEFSRIETPPSLESSAHEVLRLTLPEISVFLQRGLAQTQHPLIDGGSRTLLHGLYRKHPDSGLFAATAVPVWSIALADHPEALLEWLSAWLSLAGSPTETDDSSVATDFEPTQSHYSVLLYLVSGNFANRAAALSALEWNDVFEISGEDVRSLLDDLENAGLVEDAHVSPDGRESLLASPYHHYAEAYFKTSTC